VLDEFSQGTIVCNRSKLEEPLLGRLREKGRDLIGGAVRPYARCCQ
jgi:hypothetical protein